MKFGDAELLGMPFLLIVGKGLVNGMVELRDRRAGTREEVPVAEAVDRMASLVREALAS